MKRRWKMLRQTLWGLFVAAMALFSLYQLGHALIFGEMAVLIHRRPRSIDMSSEPFWFVFHLCVYVLGALLFSTGLYLMARGKIDFTGVWRSRMGMPPLDGERRKSPARPQD